MRYCIQITAADGTLEQLFVRNVNELRSALQHELRTMPSGTRGRLIARALLDPTHTRATVDTDRTLTITRADTAYTRRPSTRSSDTGPVDRTERRDLPFAAPTRMPRATRATPAGSGDGRTIDGYAVMWDAQYPISDRYGDYMESISRGAFRLSLRERTPIAQYDHGTHPTVGSIPVARYTSVVEDTHGLRVTGRLADSWLTEPVADAIRDGRVSGMSIRFAVTREEWNPARTRRTILGADLYEAGPVAMPASPTTSVGVRTSTAKPRTRAQRQAAARIAGVDPR